MGGASDVRIWEHAREGGFLLITKDEDFHRLSVMRGFPPKVYATDQSAANRLAGCSPFRGYERAFVFGVRVFGGSIAVGVCNGNRRFYCNKHRPGAGAFRSKPPFAIVMAMLD